MGKVIDESRGKQPVLCQTQARRKVEKERLRRLQYSEHRSLSFRIFFSRYFNIDMPLGETVLWGPQKEAGGIVDRFYSVCFTLWKVGMRISTSRISCRTLKCVVGDQHRSRGCTFLRCALCDPPSWIPQASHTARPRANFTRKPGIILRMSLSPRKLNAVTGQLVHLKAHGQRDLSVHDDTLPHVHCTDIVSPCLVLKTVTLTSVLWDSATVDHRGPTVSIMQEQLFLTA